MQSGAAASALAEDSRFSPSMVTSLIHVIQFSMLAARHDLRKVGAWVMGTVARAGGPL